LDRKKNSGNPDHDKANDIIGKIIDYAGNQDNQDEEQEEEIESNGKDKGDESEKIMT
jgi:hypothetical protein